MDATTNKASTLPRCVRELPNGRGFLRIIYWRPTTEEVLAMIDAARAAQRAQEARAARLRRVVNRRRPVPRRPLDVPS